MIVQIYAFTNVEDAIWAASHGVDHVGFVAGKYGIVHGELSFTEARAIAEALPPPAIPLALTMAAEVDEILRMAEAVQPAIVHISSDVMAVPPVQMAELRQRLNSAVRLMKAIPVDDASSMALAAQFEPVSDFLLLDTKVSGMPGVGATGRTHDWAISRQMAARWPGKVILAGGLTADNVSEAIRVVGPHGVDSNTGTNLPGNPVDKDRQRIAAFVQAARRADEAERS